MCHVKLILRLTHIVYIRFYMIYKPCEIKFDIFSGHFLCVFSILHDHMFTNIWLFMGKIENTDIQS